MNQNAEHPAVNDAVHGHFLKRVWKLTTPYWRSEEKGMAWLLLIAVIGLSLLSVAISVWFNSWYRDFYNALEKKDYEAFKHLLAYFSVIAAVGIVSGVYSSYLTQMLTIRWRRWLTEKYFAKWLSHKNYYQLEKGSRTDNPDQRLSADLNLFTDNTLGFGLSLMSNIVSLVSFSVILWRVSGDVEFMGVAIPGYMFWAALLYAIIGSWLTHVMGRRLIGLNNKQQRFEADLRFSLVRVRENSESIALFNGEKNESLRLVDRFGSVWGNFWSLMRVQKRLNFFTSGYGQIALIFPFVVAAPRYFAGKIELGGLMQITSAFSNVQSSLSWFVDVYVKLTEWRATCDRILSFSQAMDANEDRLSEIGLEHGGDHLQVNSLSLNLADGSPLLSVSGLTIGAGEHVMVSGRSGSGKSTLLRAMSGLWLTGNGGMTLPTGRSLFLPQKPYIPIGTLRGALSYPELSSTYSDERYTEVLEAARLAPLVSRLDESQHWERILSPGEQQRLAFARAMLYAPQWLYVDEATSAMDEDDEAALHEALFAHLPGLSLISVGHRSTLKRFHERHLRIEDGQLLEQA